ncbi:MAG: Lar family restriction alleviation protein [Synergistaceae bacterium]|nr:Lar family restriction alleviation protein [Synergistaceae bacterium]
MAIDISSLKPCSKCGNKPTVDVDPDTLSVSIICEHCHTSKSISLFEQVSKEWNDKQCHDEDSTPTPLDDFELLPCPFCGGEARVEQEYYEGWHVECTDCETRTREFLAEDMTAEALKEARKEAVALWNRRAANA